MGVYFMSQLCHVLIRWAGETSSKCSSEIGVKERTLEMTLQQEECELEFISFTGTKGIKQELQLIRKLGFIISCVCSTPGISESEMHLLHCE